MFSKPIGVVIALFSVCIARPATAQAQPDQPPQRVSGIVLGSTASTVTLVDKSGTEIPLTINASTTYSANKSEAGFGDVVKPGMNVRCYLASPGVAGQLIARGFADQLSTSQMRSFMHCTDDEWAIIAPRIEKIRVLQRLADGRGNNNGNGNNNGDNGQASSDSAVRALLKSLQTSYWTSGPAGTEYKANLDSLRDLRAKTRSDLLAARRELTEIVTPKQELLLVLQGVLE
jgi:hypothetical protein